MTISQGVTHSTCMHFSKCRILWKINLLGSPWDLLIFVSYPPFGVHYKFNEYMMFCYIWAISIDVEQLKWKLCQICLFSIGSLCFVCMCLQVIVDFWWLLGWVPAFFLGRVSEVFCHCLLPAHRENDLSKDSWFCA